MPMVSQLSYSKVGKKENNDGTTFWAKLPAVASWKNAPSVPNIKGESWLP